MLNGLTEETPSDIEGFKGMRTPLHQPDYHREIVLLKLREGELPEVDTVWEGQQSTCDRFHCSPQTKLEGPSKHGWDQWLGGDRQLIGAITAAGRVCVGSGHSQVLEKREWKNEVEGTWGWRAGEGYVEGFDGGRESVEWGERGRLASDPSPTAHLQMHDARKPTNPPTHFRISSRAVDEQSLGVTCRGS